MTCPTCGRPQLSERPHLHRVPPDTDPLTLPSEDYPPLDREPTPDYRLLYVVGKLLGVLLMAVILFGFGVILGAGFSVGANLVEAATPQKAPAPVFVRVFSGAAHERSDGWTRVRSSLARPVATTAPPPTPLPSVSNRLSNIGVASWHATGRSGMYAAAGPALRVGDWRGRVVQVCAVRCISVTLNDYCQCYGTRLIDLSDEAFAALAPLSKGLLRVEVSW